MTNLDLDVAQYWINHLHGDSPGLIHLCAFGDWEGRSFDWVTQEQEALAYVRAHDQAQGVYLRVTTLRDRLEAGRRGSDEDSLSLPGLWADIDLAGPGHKTSKPLPVSFEDAQRIVEAARLPEPTVWIHSGGGLYPMWLLTQAHRIGYREDFEQLRALSAKWQEIIAHGADTLGFHYGTGIGDMSRVLRLPGTVNRKEGLARPCRILEETWGRDYSLDELREALVSAVAAMPEPEPVKPHIPAPRTPQSGEMPGDAFERSNSWDDILSPAGWQIHHVRGTTTYWTRPGKAKRDGHSATTGHSGDRDRLFVFSTETEFPAFEPITKFHAYAILNHGSDHKAAAKELARQNYGDPAPRFQPPDYDAPWQDWNPASNVDSPTNGPSPNEAPVALLPKARNAIDLTLSGATSRFVKNWGHLFRYVTEEKSWRVWNGQLWESDPAGSQVLQAFEAMTEDMLDEAEDLERQAKADEDNKDKATLAKAVRKHVQQCRNASRTTIATMIATKVPVSASEFDADPRYLNLRNGVYDVVADEFLPHRPRYLLTKMAGVDYDPDAKAPRTEAFFAELLPSEQMREFTLQSLAYSLTGEADRKALFILQGVSNSGKTQITELGSNLFGDYAVAVSPGTFTKKREHGPNPELHNMRGARFVYTSETSYDIQLDEELVKRFTGKDTMSTRTLYERPQQWIPQCALWIATNNLPRFGSDSEAMWRRVKTIRFVNEFTDDASSGHQAVPNIGRTLAKEEGSGLLNLLLDALRRYRNAGKLAEPQELKDSVAEHRQETDPVLQWLSVVREKGQLVEKVGARASLSHLRKAYATWCQDEGYAPMAAQRFGIALAQALKYEKKRSNGETWMVNWEFMTPVWATWMRGD